MAQTTHRYELTDTPCPDCSELLTRQIALMTGMQGATDIERVVGYECQNEHTYSSRDPRVAAPTDSG